jgi:hypothetical protein
MTSLVTTYAAYAIDRRPIVDLSMLSWDDDAIADKLIDFYEDGFRRFIIPPMIGETIVDSSPESSARLEEVRNFVETCDNPVTVLVRFNLDGHRSEYSGLVETEFIQNAIDALVGANIRGFVGPMQRFTEDEYSGCSHPVLRQLLTLYPKFFLIRDMSSDPYVAISGSCDLPEIYECPIEILNSHSPYSGWSSESIRSSVESIVSVEVGDINAIVMQTCADWGVVPCLRILASSAYQDFSQYINAYESREKSIKTKASRARRLISFLHGCRRMCGSEYACAGFASSDLLSNKTCICPAIVDCSHHNFVDSYSHYLPESMCKSFPWYDDPLFYYASGFSQSPKLSEISPYGNVGAEKAAELVQNILAEELSQHPDYAYLGELSSAIVLRNWGRGGSASGTDEFFEETRLTNHEADKVYQLRLDSPLKDAKESVFNSNGINSCRVWMKNFLEHFDCLRQRMAVFSHISVLPPWLFVIDSDLNIDIANVVSSPSTYEGQTVYSNWTEHRLDGRWSSEKCLTINGSEYTLAEAASFSDIYFCQAFDPQGKIANTFRPEDVDSNKHHYEFIKNRAFSKWFADIARASAAHALSNSIGSMLSRHFPGIVVVAKNISPQMSSVIVEQKEAEPSFCQTQVLVYEATGVSCCLPVFPPHIGMIAQGYPGSPVISEGVRLLAKCSQNGDQKQEWYSSSPIGDCAWVYGGQGKEFAFDSQQYSIDNSVDLVAQRERISLPLSSSSVSSYPTIDFTSAAVKSPSLSSQSNGLDFI